MLWIPSLLKLEERSFDPDKDEWVAMPAEWASFGTQWCWASEGSEPDGWLKLRSDGRLETKWGSGSWEFLRTSQAPLMLINFEGTEHALRLKEGDEGRFDVVSVRKIKDGEKSLAEDPGDGSALELNAPAANMVQGWADIDA